jgi:3-oxoacyl-[acyl-carrier protein] reductase
MEAQGTAVTVNSVLPGPTETEILKAFIKSVNPDSSYAEAERKFIGGKQALIPDLSIS